MRALRAARERSAVRARQLRYVAALAGLAVLVYFAFAIFTLKQVAAPFKFASIAIILVVGVLGALAIVEEEEPDVEPAADRLYTAEEVAELLEAVRAGRIPVAGAVATCVFCGGPDPDVRGLDGSHYHHDCFQRAYRAREGERSRNR